MQHAECVERRLQDASVTLSALLVSGVRPAAYRSNMPEVVRSREESYGWTGASYRPARPSPGEIAAMDQALSWLGLLPDDKRVLRKIVAARSHVNPQTRVPFFSWRVIGTMVGASHVAVRIWHGQGIAQIVAALNRPGLCAASGGPARPAASVTDKAVAQALRRVALGRQRKTELA